MGAKGKPGARRFARTRPDPAITRPDRVVGYVRVSTFKQAEKGLSADEQRVRIARYCETYDLELVKIEDDRGRSAHSIRRPALERALAMIRAEEVGGLVVVKLDRLTRRLKDLLMLVDDYFDQANGGAHLISISESFDTRTPNGVAMLQMIGIFGEWERAMTSDRTKEIIAAKRERGEHTGGSPPYGFKVEEKDGVKMLVPDETEREVMETVKNMRSAGYSVQDITVALNEAQVPRRGGKRWNRNAVYRILE